jgi:uncharacterized protein YegP (UPF0339 family)
VTKLLSGLLAAALIAGLAGVGTAPAQDKKKTDKAAAKAGATIEISEGKDGKYRFTIRDADGKYLAGNSVGFATKDDAVKAVENLKTVLPTAKVAEGKEAKKDEKK